MIKDNQSISRYYSIIFKGSWDKLYNQLCMSRSSSSSDKSKPHYPVSNNWSTYRKWSDVDDKTREKARSIFQIPPVCLLIY